MNQPNIVEPPLEEQVSTVELAKQALTEAKELLELEIQLAKVEAREELKRVKSAAIAGGVAFALVLLGLSACVTAIILAIGVAAVYALAVAGVLLLAGGAAAAYAYSTVPKAPLDQTRERLKDDIKRLREHTA
ncbi:MAG: phage holin family protein [Myxococcota bacterium]